MVLASVGIRATIEAVCHDKKCGGEDLKKQIDSLVASGLLGRTQADYLHTDRQLGNQAVHEAQAPSDADLNIVLDVLEQLLVVLYDLPKKHQILKLRDWEPGG